MSTFEQTADEYTETCRQIRKDAQRRMVRLLAEQATLATEKVDGWAVLDNERAIADTQETLDLTAWAV